MDLEKQQERKAPKGWNRPDEVIREDVCEVLWRNQKVDTTKIEVTVESGRVTLAGVVDKESSKQEVESCVENVTGVVEVRNLLQLR